MLVPEEYELRRKAMNEMDAIQVLVCDDSALMRNLISRIIDSTHGMHTAGIAMNGQFCLDKIPLLHPDVIVLDIEMPVMNGVQFLQKRKELGIDIPIIILSSIATEGAAVTMQCLELGASDFITKPNGSVSSDISSVATHLIELISSYGGAYARMKNKTVFPPDFFLQQVKLREAEQAAAKEGILDKIKPGVTDTTTASSWMQPVAQKKTATIVPIRAGGPIEVIAIGISTGGPNALREVFAKIDPNLKQPILVVQHMPAGFTKEFAASLDRICPLDVKEAEDGDLVKPGRILIAPGDYHIYVEKKSLATVIRLSQDELRNGHRPSADVLFESVAKVYENRALGVIMTGMGRDGALKLAEMRRQGAWTLGQDEKSAIVYGMPKVAWELGAVQKQVSLDDMADEISRLAREHLS
jgi:two-component system chemotaxis response regulator CheB